MVRQKIFSRLMALLFWTPIAFFSALLAHNAMLYFTHGGEYGILPEKVIARKDIFWNVAFYVHLPFGVLCLFIPFLLFARRFFPTVHRFAGKVYVWITLSIVCPTGMYLALYAKGGLVTQVGFILQGILLALFTFQGYIGIKAGKKSTHTDSMIRSYAVATVVLTFRIFHILFFLWSVPYADNYAISQWLGLAVNLLIAEVLIAVKNFREKKNHTLKIHAI